MMPQSLARVVLHVVFSTKNRVPFLKDPDFRAMLRAIRIVLLSAVLTLHATAAVDDDFFTGPPPAPGAPPAKTARDPTPTEWDIMLDLAQWPPITLPATTITQEQARKQRLAWWRAHGFDAQLALCKGQPDEKDVRDFFDEFLPWFAGTGLPIPAGRGVKRCLAITAGEGRRAMVDFLAGCYLHAEKQYTPALKLFRSAADSPAEAPIPILARVLAQARVLHHCDRSDKKGVPSAEKLYFSLLGEQLATPCSDEDAEILVGCHLDSPISDVWTKREQRYFNLYKNAKIPEWARFTLGGAMEVTLGWRNAQNGVYPSDQKNPMKNPEGRYQRARELLTEAWRLHPQSHYAPMFMLYAIREDEGDGDDTVRLWLNRTLAACCDSDRTANALLLTNTTRWGGDNGRIIALGRACAETRRYDSGLPAFLNVCTATIATDLDDWRAIYRQSKFAPRLLETREKCLAGATTDAGRYKHQSFLFYEAWAAGDYPRANKALLALPHEDGSVLIHHLAREFGHHLGQDIAFPRFDTTVRNTPAREEYETGLAALDTGHPADARTHFNAALKAGAQSGTKLLDADIALADFQEHFDTGEWTPIPLHERLCWNFAEGTMDWQADKKQARFKCHWAFGKILFRGALGDSYEVRARFRPTRPGKDHNAAGLGVFCGHTPDTCGRDAASWWMGRIDTRSTTEMTMDFDCLYGGAAGKEKKFPWKDSMGFLMRREKSHITFVAGNKELKAQISADAPAGPDAFGLGIIAFPKGGTWTDVWSLEARKLPSQPPKLDPQWEKWWIRQ